MTEMINIKYQTKLFVVAVFTMIATCSCKKFVEIKTSPNLIGADAAFDNDNTALATVNGVYIQMRSLGTYFTNAGLSIFPSLSADEIYNTSANATYDPFLKNELLATTSSLSGNFWSQAYRIIYRSNAIMEGLQTGKNLSDGVKKQLLGEMKLVRALHYFYLVNLFGDVPLVTSTDYTVNSKMPRTAVADVYQQIITDLREAQNDLNTAYPVSGKIRPNKWAATALLSRVYLYVHDWENAEAESSSILNSGVYSLVNNLNNVFLKNSAETIWEIASANESSNTSQGAMFIPSSTTSKPAFAATTSLLNSFEVNDQRKANWLKSNVVSGVTYYYPYKYKVRSGTTATENLIVFRLAEQYLIRAEAKAQRNDLQGALADLNAIRNRAGLASVNNGTKDVILEAIRKERFTELFTEWGDRWLEIKRAGIADAILLPLKGSGWQTTDQLYPLPQSELDINVFLTQNPGY
jgi:hypothetical protein